jgi:hypothetical protein
VCTCVWGGAQSARLGAVCERARTQRNDCFHEYAPVAQRCGGFGNNNNNNNNNNNGARTMVSLSLLLLLLLLKRNAGSRRLG